MSKALSTEKKSRTLPCLGADYEHDTNMQQGLHLE